MQQRTIIASHPILCSYGVKTSDVYGRMAFHCVDNYMRQTKIYEWMDRFKGCRTSTDDDVHSEQLSTVPCVQVTEQIDQSIRDNLETSVHDSVFGFMS